MCGVVFGHAAMLDGKRSLQTQSYGSASRGGLTTSDVCIEDGEIYDLEFEELDLLVTMSQQSCDAYRRRLLSSGVLFYESDLVRTFEAPAGGAFGVRATDIAHSELGRRVVMNMVMMGFVNEIAHIVSDESLLAAALERVPPGTEKLNRDALAEGVRQAELARTA
jgi:2-oxoglutarate ferredoxin oxidoreductase subunit gamma